MKKVVVIGAGLTGSLLAIFLGRQGYQVEIYEKSDDPSVNYLNTGKSICLTLSHRGLHVLKKAGVYEDILALSVPVYGRCLHLEDNQTALQPYGHQGEALYAISRKALSHVLISAAVNTPGVSITFNQKLIRYDLETSTMTLEGPGGKRQEQTFELLVGADGTYSKVRSQMKTHIDLNYSSYINKELIIPASMARDVNLLMDHVHLWPRNEFMLIAFPNHLGDFICTLQLPEDGQAISFKQINTASKLLGAFQCLFPDVIQLIPNLKKDFFQNSEMPMITVRCLLWHDADKVVLIGDAAHAIWPSYGQGVNAGFEDCDVLSSLLMQYPDNTLKALKAFQAIRKKNTDVIAKLSEDHFSELKQWVADPNFLLRKKVERKMSSLFPGRYYCTYSRVSFTNMSYSEAVAREHESKQLIDKLLTFPEIISDLDSPEAEKVIYQTIHCFKQAIYT